MDRSSEVSSSGPGFVLVTVITTVDWNTLIVVTQITVKFGKNIISYLNIYISNWHCFSADVYVSQTTDRINSGDFVPDSLTQIHLKESKRSSQILPCLI